MQKPGWLPRNIPSLPYIEGIAKEEVVGRKTSPLSENGLALINGHEITSLREADGFALLEHTNPQEVINRRIVDEAEGLVKLLSNTDKLAKRNYRNAKETGKGHVVLPEVHAGDAYSFKLEADYDTRNQRSYTLTRSDEYKTGSEGFVLIQRGDGSVLVKIKEIDGLTPTDKDHQSDLFTKAQKWIHFYAEKSGYTPGSLLDFGRSKQELPVVKKHKDTQTFEQKLKRENRVWAGITATILTTLAYGPAVVSNQDAWVGPIPMPQPIELLVDWNNATDHDAQGFKKPDIALHLSLADGYQTSGQIPANYSYDTDGVPDANYQSFSVLNSDMDNKDKDRGNEAKPGLYSVDFNSVNSAVDNNSYCDFVKGDFGENEIGLFTQDKRVANTPDVVATLVSRSLLSICMAPDKGILPSDASVFIYTKHAEDK